MGKEEKVVEPSDNVESKGESSSVVETEPQDSDEKETPNDKKEHWPTLHDAVLPVEGNGVVKEKSPSSATASPKPSKNSPLNSNKHNEEKKKPGNRTTKPKKAAKPVLT